MGIIYISTNKINDKSYIGQTIKSLQGRITSHVNEAMNKEGFKFQRAIRKYGIENFDWKILVECENEKLNENEIYFIKKFGTVKNGYNVSHGGDGLFGLKRPEQSERMKVDNPMFNTEISKIVALKNSKRRKGVSWKDLGYSEEINKRFSERMKKNNPMFNPDSVRKANETKRLNNSYFKSHSEESKKKMSKSKSKNWIIIYPDGKEIQISNLLNFCKNNNLSCGHMSNVSSGKRIQHKGFRCRRC